MELSEGLEGLVTESLLATPDSGGCVMGWAFGVQGSWPHGKEQLWDQRSCSALKAADLQGRERVCLRHQWFTTQLVPYLRKL
jgi:plasmid replication initiation protein